jgi:hypothetical protein
MKKDVFAADAMMGQKMLESAHDQYMAHARRNRIRWHCRNAMMIIQNYSMVSLFFLFQVTICFVFWSYYRYSSDYTKMRALLGASFPLARGAAGALNVNLW